MKLMVLWMNTSSNMEDCSFCSCCFPSTEIASLAPGRSNQCQPVSWGINHMPRPHIYWYFFKTVFPSSLSKEPAHTNCLTKICVHMKTQKHNCQEHAKPTGGGKTLTVKPKPPANTGPTTKLRILLWWRHGPPYPSSDWLVLVPFEANQLGGSCPLWPTLLWPVLTHSYQCRNSSFCHFHAGFLFH